jgi:hypothetical protein
MLSGKRVHFEDLLITNAEGPSISFIKQVFKKLKDVGDKRGKGPGEFSLAVLSPKLTIFGSGDIKIGNKTIEVKASAGKTMSSGGGRIGTTGFLQHQRNAEIIKQYIPALDTSKDLNLSNLSNISKNLDVSGDLRTSGKVILEGDQIVFSPDVNLFRSSSGVLQTDSTLYIKNDLIVSGHATLGNGPQDDIHFSGYIDTDIIPTTTNTYNIGSTGNQYRNIYSASTGFFNNLNLSGNLNVSGVVRVDNHFSAITKSFLIDHPTKENKKLQYGCLEGPENGIYIRGLNDSSEILLPDYWKNLIDSSTISVNLTSIGHGNQICVLDYNSEKVVVSGHNDKKYFYTIFAERKDVEKLKVEI